MADTILKFVNGRGIPCIETIGVNVGTDAVTFQFNNHPFVSARFAGLIFVKISHTYTAPSSPLPIRFTTVGAATSTQDLIGTNNTPITSADFSNTGVYGVFYDRDTNKMQLITRM